MRRRHRQHGFTLIELMIVVSIIGILASIALPAYQVYTFKARMSEAFDFSNLARQGVVEYYGRWGRFPHDNAAAGLLAKEAYRGRSTRSLEVRDGMVAVAVAPDSAGKTYTLYVRPLLPTAPAGTAFGWICGPSVPPGFTAVGTPGPDVPPQDYLPGSCR